MIWWRRTILAGVTATLILILDAQASTLRLKSLKKRSINLNNSFQPHNGPNATVHVTYESPKEAVYSSSPHFSLCFFCMQFLRPMIQRHLFSHLGNRGAPPPPPPEPQEPSIMSTASNLPGQDEDFQAVPPGNPPPESVAHKKRSLGVVRTGIALGHEGDVPGGGQRSSSLVSRPRMVIEMLRKLLIAKRESILNQLTSNVGAGT